MDHSVSRGRAGVCIPSQWMTPQTLDLDHSKPNSRSSVPAPRAYAPPQPPTLWLHRKPRILKPREPAPCPADRGSTPSSPPRFLRARATPPPPRFSALLAKPVLVPPSTTTFAEDDDDLAHLADDSDLYADSASDETEASDYDWESFPRDLDEDDTIRVEVDMVSIAPTRPTGKLPDCAVVESDTSGEDEDGEGEVFWDASEDLSGD